MKKSVSVFIPNENIVSVIPVGGDTIRYSSSGGDIVTLERTTLERGLTVLDNVYGKEQEK